MIGDRHHVLFTAGKNPVPCLVGVARLMTFLREQHDELPAVTAIAAGTTVPPEVTAIRDLLYRRFSRSDFWRDPWLVRDARDPQEILATIRARLPRLGSPGMIYFHYSGGTKAMIVHTMEALRDLDDGKPESSRLQIQLSYLNAERHRVLTEGGPLLTGGADDERDDWGLTVADLARLHEIVVEPLSVVTPVQVEAAAETFDALMDPGCWQEYLVWEGDYRQNALGGRWDRIRERDFPAEPVPWPCISSPSWNSATLALSAATESEFLRNSSAGWALDFGSVSETAVQRFNRLIASGTLLELAAYKAFIVALGRVGRATDGERARHSVLLKLGTVTAEVDIAAVLGFQLVAVSCTRAGAGSRHEIKARGFEVLHRARQLGGDGARAILICRLNASDAWKLEQDLRDDTGISEPPLRVWGADKWDDLRAAFAEYLIDELRIEPWTTPASA